MELVEIGPLELAIMFAIILGVATLAFFAKLDLANAIFVAAVRCLGQLALMGFILSYLFEIREPAMILAYVLLMIALASREAFARAKVFYAGLFTNIFLSFVASVSIVGIFGGLFLVLRPDPFFDPRYFIPICGMMLGNGLTGMTLATDLFMAHLKEKKEHIEVLLAYGASPWLALRPGIRTIMKRSMTPTLNQMTVAGLVSIPGMMTGQVLGGSSPFQAALYQVFIFYLISSCTFFSTTFMLLLSVKSLVDDRRRIVFGLLRQEKRLKVADIVVLPITVIGRWLRRAKSEKEEEARNTPDTSPPCKGPRILHACPSEAKRESPMPVLTFSASALRHDGGSGRVLLKDLEISLGRGQTACIAGPSGSGKSTLLYVLADLLRCEDCELSLQGQRASQCSPTTWRQQVRYCSMPRSPLEGAPQDFAITLMGLGYKNLLSEVEDYLKTWGMSPDLLLSSWGSLSTGEAQRIWLAFAFASKPSLVLLDEPTSALDEQSTIRVESSLRDFLDAGGAAVVVTHSEAQRSRLGGEIWTIQDPSDDAAACEDEANHQGWHPSSEPKVLSTATTATASAEAIGVSGVSIAVAGDESPAGRAPRGTA